MSGPEYVCPFFAVGSTVYYTGLFTVYIVLRCLQVKLANASKDFKSVLELRTEVWIFCYVCTCVY